MTISEMNLVCEILIAVYIEITLISLIVIAGSMIQMKRHAYKSYGRNLMKDLKIDSRVRMGARKYEIAVYLICFVPILHIANLNEFLSSYDVMEQSYMESCGILIVRDLTIMMVGQGSVIRVGGSKADEEETS